MIFVVGSAALLLVIVAYYAFIWRNEVNFTNAMDHGYLFADYQLHFEPMGHEILRTHKPVAGWYYSPMFAIALSPFATLDLRAGMQVWGVLQVAAAVMLCLIPGYWLLEELRSLRPALAYVALCATAHPLLANYAWGQTSTFIVLAWICSIIAYARQRHLTAAALLVLATSIKYYPALWIAHIATRRDRQTLVLIAVLGGLMLILLPFIVLGWNDMLQFQRLVEDNLRASDWFSQDANSQFLPHVLARLTGAGLRLGYAVTYTLFAANLVAVWLLRRKTGRAALLAPVFLLLSVPLAVRTSWPHYFGYLPFCQVMLWWMTSLVGLSRSRRIVLRCGIAASVVASNILFFNLVANWEAYGRLGAPLLANALLIAVAWALLPGVRKVDTPRGASSTSAASLQ